MVRTHSGIVYLDLLYAGKSGESIARNIFASVAVHCGPVLLLGDVIYVFKYLDVAVNPQWKQPVKTRFTD